MSLVWRAESPENCVWSGCEVERVSEGPGDPSLVGVSSGPCLC